MSVTHIISRGFKADALTVPIGDITLLTDSAYVGSWLVPAGTTKEFDAVFAHLAINNYCITLLDSLGKKEAPTGSVTIKWNDATTPVPSMPVAAKSAIFHAPGLGTTSAFTADLTKAIVVNTGTVDVTVSVHVGLNVGV